MEKTRHKNDNRFKFIPFSERISNVNIDIFHRVPHPFEEESTEKFTHLYLTLRKWSDLNLTDKFEKFKKAIGKDFVTLPQLINNKEKIFSVFLKQIRLQDELSLQPVLESIVALVKDLRHEFYPFYPQILKELILLLKYKDPDVLEATFSCLAYLFKYLSRELVKDLDKVLLDLAPLLNSNNPDYVTDFAAQSFSFVARKVKDKNKFLSLVLYAVQSSPQLSDGCAQLLFEMMKGIQGHTHSCAEELFQVLFYSLGKSDFPQKSLFLLTSQVVSNYGSNISPQYSILFRILVDVLKSKLESENMKGVKKLLKLTKLALHCKGGAHLNEECLSQLVTLLVKLLSMNEDLQKLASEICSDMLQLRNLKLQQEFASRLITKVMQIKVTTTLLQFIENTSFCSSFEATILPRALQYFASLDSPEFLEVLTKLVVKKTAQNVKTFNTLSTYPIALTPTTAQLFTFVKDTLTKFDEVKNILLSLILIRHLEPIDRKSVVPLIINIINTAVDKLPEASDKKDYLFVLCIALDTLLHFKKELSNLEDVNGTQLCEVLLKILQSDKSILSLRCLDLFLTLSDNLAFSEELFNELYCTIEDWVLSPQSNARLLALHSLKKLEESKLNNDMVEALGNALSAEFVPLTTVDYREKIKFLEMLNFERLESLQEKQHKVLLKYLLGVLYCNFKLIWDPVSRLIASYSIGMSTNSFWDVFFSYLRTATAHCKGMALSQNFNLPSFDEFLLNSLQFLKAEDKPAHQNYKYLMWNTMSLFPDVCETKNRDVVSVYLSFIEDEILKSSSEHSLTISVRKNELTEAENEDSNMNESSAAESKKKSHYADVLKCGVAQLALLSKFKNPTHCYREQDVRNSYLELLLHKDTDIQKMALECLLNYKFSYLTPYKENLRNLIDDMKFKNELVLFQIDTETGVVKDVHRNDLMPIVMRILYTKMWFRSSTPRGNRGSASSLRRSVIFRFLAGSSHSEMEIFLKMAFKFCNSYCEAENFPFEAIKNSIDLEKVPNPKRLQNIVNLAEVVLNNFGGLMPTRLQHYIYKVLLSVGSFVSGIFQKRDEIHPGYVPSLRNIRNTSLEIITKFFDRFENFPWKKDDINALFHVFIWPNLSKLPFEGIHSPTALLRLFATWAKNPRYFKLLAKFNENDKAMSPLPFVMQLLLNEKSQPSVISCITSILENLLTLQEEEPMEVDDEEVPSSLDVDFVLPVDESGIEKLNLKEELNYGSKILFPHVADILTCLRRKLEKSNRSGLGKNYVAVLSRITEMATSPENGDALMKLLLKMLSFTKQADDDALVNMATTIENLSKIVPNPESYLRSLSVLFGTIELIQARKVLVNLVVNFKCQCPNLSKALKIIEDLNAWDARWMAQPDFERRLEAFKQIRALVDEGNCNIDLALIILHNCFFFVRSETDLSLRENASFCLKDICPKIANQLKNKPSNKNQWIESILTLTKRGIVSENENYQTVSILLLGVMARECGELHPVLRDLSVLTNKDNPEVDFFENAQHLQIYRRLKALQKFSTVAKTLKKAPLTRTLVQFILPLASRYLATEKYATGKNTLIDSAIDAVATVCKFLPWYHYQTVLRFYLTKLRTKIQFQKQLTRLVIAILDSFHFDLSKSPVVEQQTSGKRKFGRAFLKLKTNNSLREEVLSENKTEDTKSEERNKEKMEEERVEENEKEKKDDCGKEKQEGDEMEKEQKEKQEDETEKKQENEIEGQKDEIEKEQKDEKEAGTVEKDETTEDLTEALEVVEEEEEDDGNRKEIVEEKKGFAIDSIIVLNPAAASKVEKAVSGSLLKDIYKIIGQKTQLERTHKLNQKNLGDDRDEEDILKVPLAVTLVKLLQKLPERMLESQLPGIFMKLSTYLKSRVESVRRVTRGTLQQIIASVGPKYLPLLFSEMTAVLKKGFQAHVLVYTIHAIILHVHSLLQPGDIDANLPILLEVCKSDLFGVLSEEKTVAQIQAQHKEAKSTKCYHLINLIAQCITEKCLTNLILPVKEVLQTSYSHKNITKCREYLRQVTLGLSANKFITMETLYIYVYGTTSESIPQLMPTPKPPTKKKNPREKQDCFIIPPEPKSRTGVFSNAVKKSSRSNAHIIIEFGFSLLHSLLKKEKVKSSDCDIRCYLDPIAPILVSALESQHVKVSTLALQCLSKLIKYHLPKIKEELKTIKNCLFSILHKYAAAGLCKGDNFDLVMATFKAVSTLIREADYLDITPEQLKILLLYAEQDIYDSTRQATAFNLLKIILRKKLNSPELHDLMKKVAALSITSELAHVRIQARQNVFQYIMDYPLKSKLEEFIGFFISQLNFGAESGRQSTLEMIQNFITSFPESVLQEQCGVFLLTLGARLMNDDSPNCKKTISGIIKAMLTRLDSVHRDQLYSVLMKWFNQKKILHRRLAAQIAGIFVTVEKEKFEKRLPALLPVIQEQFVGGSQPGKFVRLPQDNGEEDRLKDYHFFQVLQLLLKICSNVSNFLTGDDYQDHIFFFTEIAQSLLCHPHEWVRLASTQFLGYVFNSCPPEEVSAVLSGHKVESKLSFLEPVTIHRRIKSLILDHCAQFIPGTEIRPEFLDQSTKNLVYFARVLKNVKKKETNDEKVEKDDVEEDSSSTILSFLWLTRRMRRIVNMEIVQTPTSSVLRCAVLKWIGAVALSATRSELRPALYHLLAPVIREREIMEGESKENPMKPLVIEVCDVLKKKVGVDEYSRVVIKIKGKLMEKRTQRKSQRAIEFITDPEKAVRKKIERHIKKKQAKKRKLEKIKRKKGNNFKRRKKENDSY